MKQDDLFGQRAALPDGFIYRREFITAAEEAQLVKTIRELPLEKAQYLQYTARRRIVAPGFRTSPR